MEVKTGKKLSKTIYQINQDEEMRSLAKDDPDAILLYDKTESIINTDYANDIDYAYDDAADYLRSRLKANAGSIDKLADELGYRRKYDFIDDLMMGLDNMTDVLVDCYNGVKLSDLFEWGTELWIYLKLMML